MGRLIYSMGVSADGFVADADGVFAWGAVDEELHTFAGEISRSVGTYLYGRRMYEIMLFWETAEAEPEHPPFILEYARQWKACDKVVYSTTLEQPRSGRTTLRSSLDLEEIATWKAERDHDLTVDGPTLAAQLLEAGLVDEVQLLIAPVVVGGGLRFFPGGWRADLTLLDERRFANGTVYVRYRVTG